MKRMGMFGSIGVMGNTVANTVGSGLRLGSKVLGYAAQLGHKFVDPKQCIALI